jgi:hypothetical protein
LRTIDCFGIAAFLGLVALVPSASAQENNQPPNGFVALFNGKDLLGWYGLGHFDPRATLTYPKFVTAFAANDAYLKKHGRV